MSDDHPKFPPGFFDSLKNLQMPKPRIEAVELQPVVNPLLARVDKLLERLDGQSKPVVTNQPREKGKPGRHREKWKDKLAEFCETLTPYTYPAFLKAVKEGKIECIREAQYSVGVVFVRRNDGMDGKVGKKEINAALRAQRKKILS